jgi:hypothetical protein
MSACEKRETGTLVGRNDIGSELSGGIFGVKKVWRHVYEAGMLLVFTRIS